MAEFITYAEPGSFEIDFKTTDYSEYREIEEAAREIIDRHTGTHDSDHISVDIKTTLAVPELVKLIREALLDYPEALESVISKLSDFIQGGEADV